MNFSYFPLPDSVDDVSNGDACSYGDQVEACALDTTGCFGSGCTGKSLTQLASFVSCYEHSWVEMMCVGSKTKAVSCAKSSGIDSDKLNACLNDSSKVKKLEEELNAADPGVRMYPTVKIGTVRLFLLLLLSLHYQTLALENQVRKMRATHRKIRPISKRHYVRRVCKLHVNVCVCVFVESSVRVIFL